LHAELRWLPCSPAGRELAALRRPTRPCRPRLVPRQCRQKVHDRDNLGLGRLVHTSRLWSGKAVVQHRADRAQVVREALLWAGLDAPDLNRMAASVTLPDGSPRFVWTDVRPDHDTYVKIILDSVRERHRWCRRNKNAKTTAAATDGVAVGLSTVAQPP
jgi:hypothetical protein